MVRADSLFLNSFQITLDCKHNLYYNMSHIYYNILYYDVGSTDRKGGAAIIVVTWYSCNVVVRFTSKSIFVKEWPTFQFHLL